MMRLSRSLSLMWIFGVVLSCGAACGSDRRPNIVLIYADDLGWNDVGFNGRKDWATPNLDKLAASGTVFTRFYASAVVCGPSRASMLTGKAPIHCGVSRNDEDLPAEEVTIAEALKARGYATALFGKWHHGKPRSKEGYVHPMDQGFDEFFGFTDAYHAFEKFPKSLWDGRARRPVSGYADDLFTDRGVDFIRRQDDRPFFLYLPYISAHFTIAAPADEVELHRGKFAEADPARPLNATYAAMVTRFDKNVGRILAALDEQGLADDTIVVFTSDHGASFEAGNLGTSQALGSNHPFRGQKRTLWEGGVRVPAAVRWPGQVAAGAVSAEVVQMIDLMPTFLAAAGGHAESSWQIDGVDLLPSWTGQSPAPERTLFWEWRCEGADQRAALRGNHKLVVTRGGKPELYDVVADPGELRDLAATNPALAQDLEQALMTWIATERRSDPHPVANLSPSRSSQSMEPLR
ncbi:sulfatase-like hydrolase/transferase [Tundrisphaera sp. TA3]|uniref:sulfatase-like hydrolase/transferase n=1 Tax=Tundrisphaera sp. TA3 TaxID=3435775 RepID=UPI003EC026B1